MPFVKSFTDSEQYCIFKRGSNPSESEYNYRHKILEGVNYLYVGTPGAGKSIGTMSLVEEYWRQECTCIFITTKPNSESDNASAIFPPDKKYHLDLLKMCDKTAMTQEECKRLVKIWTPFSFKLADKIKKHRLMPQMNIFTIPLKSIGEAGMSAIMSGTTDKAYTRAALSILQTMPKEATLFDFAWECSKQISKEAGSNKADMNSDDLVVQPIHAKTTGDARTVQMIKDHLNVFVKDYFFTPENASTNLDMLELLNDNKHLHFFNDFLISSERAKYAFYVQIIDKINEAMKTGKVKHHVVLVFEEIKVLLPEKDVAYIKELTNSLRTILSTMRSSGRGMTCIATTQNYAETNSEFRSTCNEVYFGKISHDDIKALSRDYGLSADGRRALERLNVGRFINFTDLQRGDFDPNVIYMPSFGVAESSDDFLERYRRYYPELLCDYTFTLKMFENQREEARKRVVEEFKKFEDKQAEAADEKEFRKKTKEKITAKVIEEKVAQKKSTLDKQTLAKQAYEWKKSGVCGSFAEVSRKLGIDRSRAQRLALKHATKVGDVDFLNANT